ncbi:cellulase family glycosylhydrolase [Histomonas meleagridis]|uniref:cellulase family glycosylhydrolase n=1 Tax=Histomonas meleagridis TaxID=135588 RepID=UPI003559389D|nr:cellulase family glycosylhydrolase [Histomonas meleagridis]KAH0802650.1 cellulase family glycosylhydrolase [Histomonas meleagridis]
MSYLNQQKADQRIIIKDGHFAYENGTRVRFVGVSFIGANFYTSREHADEIAERLSQLGVNLVRFHNIDQPSKSSHLWADYNQQTDFDPDQVAAFRYMINALKQRGIYTNINIKVSRQYPSLQLYNYDYNVIKSIEYLHEPFIQSNIDYITKLLQVQNYENTSTLANDPCIAFFELNNENDIFQVSYQNFKQWIEIQDNVIYLSSIKDKWYTYLKDTYHDYNSLDHKINWELFDESLDLVSNYTAECNWHNTYKCTNTDNEWVIDIQQTSDYRYRHQLLTHVNPPVFQPNTYYTIQFTARSNQEKFNISAQLVSGEYNIGEIIPDVTITNENQEYNIVFKTYDEDEGWGQFNFSKPQTVSVTLENKPAIIYITKPKVFKGRKHVEFSDSQTLDTVWFPYPIDSTIDELNAEFRSFLGYIEANYTKRMMKTIRDLGCQTLITPTQMNYGNPITISKRAELTDYSDFHSYWNHPTYTNGQTWDYNYLITENRPMSEDENFGAFSFLSYKIYGKPYSLSEYNHPFPNDYINEMVPMLFPIMSYYDLDSVSLFFWNNQYDNISEKEFIHDPFSITNSPIVTTLIPFASIAFREFSIKEATHKVKVTFPSAFIDFCNLKDNINHEWFWNKGMINKNCVIPQELTFIKDEGNNLLVDDDICVQQENKFPYVIGDEIIWEKGKFITNSSKVIFATGTQLSNALDFGPLIVSMDQKEHSSRTFAAASLDNKPLTSSRKFIIAVVGNEMNSNQKWNNDRTSTGSANGGNYGTEPILVEKIKFTVNIKGGNNYTITKLSPNAMPIGECKFNEEENGISFTNDNNNPTLWYLVERNMTQLPSENGNSNETTIIIVVVVVVVVVIVAVALITFFVIKKRKEKLNDSSGPNL